MSMHRKYQSWSFAGVITLLLAVVLLAWNDSPARHQPGVMANLGQDTVPQRTKVTRQPGDKDLDYELRQLNQAQKQLENMDWSEIEKSVETALKAVDMEKIHMDALKAIESIDFEKIGREIELSLSKIDFDAISNSITTSLEGLEEVDMEEIKEELKKAKQEVKKELENKEWKKELEMEKKINKEELRREFEEAKKEIAEAREEMKKEKLNFKEEMKNAGKEIEEAKAELKAYQEMNYALEAEGLLDTKKDYSIEYKNGNLFINGTQQPESVTGKYKKYFKKDKVKIVKEDGDIDINHGNSNNNKD